MHLARISRNKKWYPREVTLLRLRVISTVLFFLTKGACLAEVTGFEPVMTISKTVALDQTRRHPNKKIWHPARDSNPDQQFWRLVCCHYTSEILTLVSDTGFEPAPSWPQTRWTSYYPNPRNMVDRNGIEPFLQTCKARVPPTTPTAHIFQRTVANACNKKHSLRHRSPGQLYALYYATFLHISVIA